MVWTLRDGDCASLCPCNSFFPSGLFPVLFPFVFVTNIRFGASCRKACQFCRFARFRLDSPLRVSGGQDGCKSRCFTASRADQQACIRTARGRESMLGSRFLRLNVGCKKDGEKKCRLERAAIQGIDLFQNHGKLQKKWVERSWN